MKKWSIFRKRIEDDYTVILDSDAIPFKVEGLDIPSDAYIYYFKSVEVEGFE